MAVGGNLGRTCPVCAPLLIPIGSVVTGPYPSSPHAWTSTTSAPVENDLHPPPADAVPFGIGWTCRLNGVGFEEAGSVSSSFVGPADKFRGFCGFGGLTTFLDKTVTLGLSVSASGGRTSMLSSIDGSILFESRLRVSSSSSSSHFFPTTPLVFVFLVHPVVDSSSSLLSSSKVRELSWS